MSPIPFEGVGLFDFRGASPMAYVGFDKLKGQIASKGNVQNPGAVAAAIGRKKYGGRAMSKAASTGTSLKGHRTVSGRR